MLTAIEVAAVSPLTLLAPWSARFTAGLRVCLAIVKGDSR
jgi:hypothetical protein